MAPPRRSHWPQHSASSTARLLGTSLVCLLLNPQPARGFRTSVALANRNRSGTWKRLATPGAFPMSSSSRRASGQRREYTTNAVTDGDTNAAVSPASSPSVCVIGAGAAGLAAGRVLREEGCRVTVLEKSLNVGGVWRYTPKTEATEGTKAPMYRSLVTNLPKEVMSFFNFPFPEENQSFTTHAEVQDYLCAYARENELYPLIKLGCQVETVRPVATREFEGAERLGTDSSDSDKTVRQGEVTAAADRDNEGQAKSQREHEGTLGKWEVVYRSRSDGTSPAADTSDVISLGAADTAATATATPNRETRVTQLFDAVCICSGHFDEAFTPETDGMEEFRGKVMHAREYDIPGVEAFIGKRVLCIGSKSSGTDIAREVSSVAAVVHVCDRKNFTSVRGGERDNVWWRPALERFEGTNGVRFKSGELEEVDTVVWCTGYDYSFPFLEDTGLLTPPVSMRVHPLYEQLFHVRHPSLSFIGLPQSIVPFPLFEAQANAVAAAITGRASLPTLAEREQWLREEEESLRERDVDPASRGAHVLGGRQWEYQRRLLRLASGPGVLGSEEISGVGGSNQEAASTGSCNGGGAESEALLRVMSLKEAIYNDVGASRPKMPGGPDDYRRRQYSVDWQSGSFSVSYAELKANGEGPSAT